MSSPALSPKALRDALRRGLPGRLLLGTLSLLYGAAVAARGALYRAGILRSRSLPVPVICFGNISAGGTGKTSTVIAAAQELARSGRKPAVLLRGYKRRVSPRTLTVLAPGRRFTLDEAGDEALMLYRTLEKDSVPVLVCADRYRAGLEAVRELGADVLLMDDGFQHFALRRDADIVLVNATAPFRSDRLLPLGDLREPASALRRARAVIISHCEQASQEAVDALAAEIKRAAAREGLDVVDFYSLLPRPGGAAAPLFRLDGGAYGLAPGPEARRAMGERLFRKAADGYR